MSETPEQIVEPPRTDTDGAWPAQLYAGLRTRATRAGLVSAWVALWAAVAAYCAVVGVYVILDHNSFRTQAFDLGIFDQALWLVSHGESLNFKELRAGQGYGLTLPLLFLLAKERKAIEMELGKRHPLTLFQGLSFEGLAPKPKRR